MDDILRCDSKSQMDRLLQNCTQMVACQLIPYASRHQLWVVLLKLFVFGSNIALQKKAGQTLHAGLLRALCTPNTCRARSMEEVLLKGLSVDSIQMNLSLASVFSELFCLITAAMALPYRETVFEKKQKAVLLGSKTDMLSFVQKCSDREKSLSNGNQSLEHKRHQDSLFHNLQFHMQLAMDFLEVNLRSPERGVVGYIINTMQRNSNEGKTPDEKTQLKQMLKTLLSKEKPIETDICLLLLYMASHIKNHPRSLIFCYTFFAIQLKEARTKILGKVVKKNKRMLVSCAQFCLHMCQSVISDGKYFLWMLCRSEDKFPLTPLVIFLYIVFNFHL